MGQTLSLKLVVINDGDGDAEDVTIIPQVPGEALSSGEAGKPLEVGILPAGESREMLYAVNALGSGTLQMSFEAFEWYGQQGHGTCGHPDPSAHA